MSLHPQEIPSVPAETHRVAQAAFPHGNIDMAPLFPLRGQPAESPWRLALTTAMPFAEGLSDRFGAVCTRRRHAGQKPPLA